METSDSDRAILLPGKQLDEIVELGGHLKRKYLIIIDDNDSELDDFSVREFIQYAVDTYFIIITRNIRIKEINFGVKDVFTFSRVGK